MVTANPVNKLVGGRIRDALKEAGIPQRTACEQTGIAQVTLTRKLGGRAPFTVEELVSLSECVDTDPSVFLAGLKKDPESAGQS
ncbi:helix-turn-helix domain-containing protein [Nocardia cyriacigeorgica]|uniref:Helix-turn-helix transcriptional regulator n=1 Tax=Nocardia cyriacigeorgica TaxID=135487 RepID=A0A5R8NEQ9_9NOCA|nr:helix-turn-helix transcriptional regulator [Nocardia cyriacigeorgica]TLF74096.1 helix-turn-helix transcriptional regulator [Nocardia cyriacigeorgica]